MPSDSICFGNSDLPVEIVDYINVLGFDGPDFIQEMLSPTRKLFIWEGPSRTGKSTLSQKISSNYPQDTRVTSLSSLMRRDVLNPELCQILKDKCKLVIVEYSDCYGEEESGSLPSMIKRLLCRDKIYVREFNEKGREFEPNFNILMICNDLPKYYKEIVDQERDSSWWGWFKSFIVLPPSPKKVENFRGFTLVRFTKLFN